MDDALKEKTFRALHQPQKVLVVELLLFALPDVPGALRGHRADGYTRPLGRRPTPLFVPRFYMRRRRSSITLLPQLF